MKISTKLRFVDDTAKQPKAAALNHNEEITNTRTIIDDMVVLSPGNEVFKRTLEESDLVQQ